MAARKRCEEIPMLSTVLQQLMQFDGQARMQYKVGQRSLTDHFVGFAATSIVRLLTSERGGWTEKSE